jgi:hypothetical protein
MQWFDKHVSTIEAVFSAWSVRRLYNDNVEEEDDEEEKKKKNEYTILLGSLKERETWKK